MKREMPEGFHAEFTHMRAVTGGDIPCVSPKGGATMCDIVEDSTNRIMATGVAWCNKTDNFSRPLGRKISEGRALKQLYALATEAHDAR